MRRTVRRAIVVLGLLATVVLVAVVIYLVAGRPDPGLVAPNVVVAGRDVGGRSLEHTRVVVGRAAAQWPTTDIRVRVGTEGFVTTAGALGVTVDVDRSVGEARRMGRAGGVVTRFFSWVRSPLRARVAPLRFGVDEEKMRAAMLRLDPGEKRPPREPSFGLRGDRVRTISGANGLGAAPDAAFRAIARAAETGGWDRVTVSVPRGPVPPRFSVADARAVGDEALRLTDKGLPVRAGRASTTIEPEAMRPWFSARPGQGKLGLTVDAAAATNALEKLLPNAGTPAVDAGFAVTPEGVQITPARAGTACCDPDSVAKVVLGAVLDRGPGPAEVGLRTVAPKRNDAAAAGLGIREPVASFTTAHKCCEPRVQNIHRIADILRGYVIEPGQTFSVNDAVGMRTAQKGFVSAPVIENGQMASDVGGGVSQFATTLFNAAWFAGLGFGEYQSHSLYISRYPYGREATMGFPNPDLEIKNTTPYGVLLWPTYTGTTLTVTVYSTKLYASVTMSNQTRTRQGTCTAVSTERTRVGLDGKTSVDRTSARYRAEPGLNCDGTRAPAPRPGG